ncbi:MAG: ATP-binding cassette domain-containing protein [Deltaproteobacteria bacterium]|nr:MAG: ATP-binding cassette domain-containing protein [Deltaproteobacteria bacterium]
MQSAARKQDAIPSDCVDVRDLTVVRGSRPVFRGLSCRFPLGKISVVLGGSGSGKSTLLRALACLLRPDSGEIWLGEDTQLCGMSERRVRSYRERVGMMFQGGALLDSMTVFDNVALPLRERTRRSRAEIEREVHGVFESVGLEQVDALLPGQLSGGMLRRAALARALITQPQILLCDEPFSGLDPNTVRRVESLLVDLNRELQITMIIASHHIASTLRMADHVVVLVDGSAVSGTPEAVRRATHPRVAEFFVEEAFAPDAEQPPPDASGPGGNPA